jgi:hypothetical protein
VLPQVVTPAPCQDLQTLTVGSATSMSYLDLNPYSRILQVQGSVKKVGS